MLRAAERPTTPLARRAAGDLAAMLDPVILARRMGIEPDPWQARLLRSTAPRVALNIARQVGKSTAAGILASHTAIYEPGSLTLLLSPSLRQSGELFRKVRAGLGALGIGTADLSTDNALSCELANASRVVSLPGKAGTIRGYSGVRLLIIDEAAQVLDEPYRAVRPMLSVSGGRLVTMSTPFGKRGWWWEAWEAAAQAWERFKVTAAECPRHSPAFLTEERKALAEFYAQEYECEFLDPEMALFTAAAIDKLFDTDAAPLFPLTLPA